MIANCSILTPKVKEFAKQFTDETEQSVLNLIQIWRTLYNKTADDVPSKAAFEITRSFFRNKMSNVSLEEIGDRINELKEIGVKDDKLLDELSKTPKEYKEQTYKQTTYNKAVTIETREKVNALFTPRTRRNRVSLISRLFSSELDRATNEMMSNFATRIENSNNNTEKSELSKELEGLNRMEVLKQLTPSGIFEKVKDIFKTYINATEEERVQYELSAIEAKKGSNKFTKTQKLEAAKKNAEHKFQEYSKMISDEDIFRSLCEEASLELMLTEGFVVDGNMPQDIQDISNPVDIEEGKKEEDKEASVKDGWMINFRQLSARESLSKNVRKLLRTIPVLNNKGKYEKDDLGYQIYLKPTYAFTTLMHGLRWMTEPSDMMPLLEQLAKRKPWVKQVIKKLQNDDALFSQFYQNFRKDFTNYWIQKKKLMPDGTYTTQTVPVNKPEGVEYIINQWQDNFNAGIILDEDSIYDNNGKLIKENAAKGLSFVVELNNEFNNKTSEEIEELLKQPKTWNKLKKTLKMAGIDINPDTLKQILESVKLYNGKKKDPIKDVLFNLNIIFSQISKGVVTEDLFNNLDSAYTEIANMISDVTEDAIESSCRENEKSYYAHTNPNYLGKLIKNLKNVMNDKKRFDEFMQNEYKQYEWFFKNGHWRNDLIGQLATNPIIRKGLDHKVVLNRDKIEYSSWSDLDYTLAILTEYNGDVASNKSNVKFGWFAVPILADAPSAEFLRLRKYTTGDVLDEDGRKLTYDEVILDKLVNLVEQEYDRIMLVRKRAALIQQGLIVPIANYDITYNENGEISKLGGAEFKFLPGLNNGKFLEELTKLKNDSSVTGERIKNFIKFNLFENMETEFKKALLEWEQTGLFEENNGKYVHLEHIKNGQSAQNEKLANTLKTAKQIIGSNWFKEAEDLLIKVVTNKIYYGEDVFKTFDEIVSLLDVNNPGYTNVIKNLVYKNNAVENLREFFYNHVLNTANIIQLCTTDLAYYKNMEDFQKRFKEVHAPSLRLNTLAKYKGEQIGREFERTIYLSDEIIKSSVQEDIKEVLDVKVTKGELTTLDRDYILSPYKQVNVADAQAYRSLSSYRAILGMSGEWTDEMQEAYERLKNGNWSIADFNIIWQPKKPFVYTQVAEDSGVEGIKIKQPIQHKNAEFPLLVMYTMAQSLGKASKLRAINKFMEMPDVNMDVVQFESTTKVGNKGTIDLHDCNTEEEVIARLREVTGISTGKENPEVVHIIPYADYGIQTATPEHGIDAIQLVGSQIRKLIMADIADTAIININGKKLTKAEWIKEYNAVVTENILQSFKEVKSLFEDPKKVEARIMKEIKGNPSYGLEMIKAFTLDENDNFNIPWFEPSQSIKAQQLIYSIIKNDITKQKIKGGALIQVTSYGYTDDLKIVFEGKGENKRIKYFECYMPAYSREFYEPLMNPDTGELDINKLPEDLRHVIGYRVPTENKYSMMPLRIKGFLPVQNGSCIMLPAEITVNTGSDFDVDKLYIMLPEFKTSNYDMTKARKDYAKIDVTYKNVLKSFSDNQLAEDLLENDTSTFKEWFKAHKEEYEGGETKFRKVYYNHNKSASGNSLAARNNYMIDLMWGILTNPDTASKIVTPSNFDEQKTTARITKILSSFNEKEIKDILKNLGITPKSSVIEYLLEASLKTLNKIADKAKTTINPLSPRTQIYFHQQNMTGGKMIGIYANHNAAHALAQLTQLEIKEDKAFTLNGKKLTSLHNIKTKEGKFISFISAGFLAASVDNVKDPVLAALNQNEFTADATMLLARLGYSVKEIGLLVAQPIVKEMAVRYIQKRKSYPTKEEIADELIKEYFEKNATTLNVTKGSYRKNNGFSLKWLAENIMLQHESVLGNNASTMEAVEYYGRQAEVGTLFKKILNIGEALGDLTQATRADTQNGAAGPTIADTIRQEDKLESVYNAVQSKKYPLQNINIIAPNLFVNEDSLGNNWEEKMRKELLRSALPFLQAFHSLGLEESNTMLQRYFPQFSSPFIDVITELQSYTKTGKLSVKTMNSIYNDLFAYIMSKEDFFGAETSLEGNVINSANKRDRFINKFPQEFKKIVENNEDIASLEFIKRLRVIRSNDYTPVSSIVFKNVSKLTPDLKEIYIRDWESLLYMNNPVANQLAFDLFRYSYFRTGFAFAPNSFMHLAPVALKKIIPNYINKLLDLLKSTDNYGEFVDQYIYNHLDNRQLVPEIHNNDEIFKDEKGDILDTINLNYTITEAVQKEIWIDGEKSYVFMPYIGKRLNGKFVYYRLKNNFEDNAIYTRIDPLGYKNSFLEYEYGKDVEDMKSVIVENDRNYKPSEFIDFRNFKDNIEYFEENSENFESVDFTPPVTYDSSYDAEAALASLGDLNYLFGESQEGSNSQEAFNNNPVERGKDADDQNICGDGFEVLAEI